MEQAVSTGIVAVDDGKGNLTITINEKAARGFLTANGNRSVSSGGFKPIVFGGRVWNISLNLYSVATESERESLPEKPQKERKGGRK